MKRLAILAAVALAVATPAAARTPLATHFAAGDGVAQTCGVPLSQVLGMIARSTPGTHLDSERGDSGGRPVYIVRWRTNEGRVIIFIVDADSGQILSRRGG